MPDDEQEDNWEHVSICAQRMIMGFDHVEMQDEARSIVRYSTPRQQAYIFEALWTETDDAFRARAWAWLTKRRAEAEENANVDP